MKRLALIPLLAVCTCTWAEDVEALKAQKLAVTKEVSDFRQAHIKTDPELAKQKAAIDELTKKLYTQADESLKDDPKYKELREKLRTINAELKKAESAK